MTFTGEDKKKVILNKIRQDTPNLTTIFSYNGRCINIINPVTYVYLASGTLITAFT